MGKSRNARDCPSSFWNPETINSHWAVFVIAARQTKSPFQSKCHNDLHISGQLLLEIKIFCERRRHQGWGVVERYVRSAWLTRNHTSEVTCLQPPGAWGATPSTEHHCAWMCIRLSLSAPQFSPAYSPKQSSSTWVNPKFLPLHSLIFKLFHYQIWGCSKEDNSANWVQLLKNSIE